MPTSSSNHIVIIGAGIVGVSCALWLRRSGCSVTVIDRSGISELTSYGNAGILASSSVVPVQMPGLLPKIPKMLLSSDGPLFVRWRDLPRLLPFLFRFLRNGRRDRVESISDSLSLLLHDCPAQHLSLAEGTAAERFIHSGSWLFGYDSRKSYESDSLGWEFRRQRGHHFEEMSESDITAYDSLLEGRFGTIIRCDDSGHISDPQAYIQALMHHGQEQGIEFIKAEVEDIIVKDSKAMGVIIDSKEIESDHVVLAAGIWSRELASKVGYKIPIETERGYHIEFVNPSIKLRSPIMVSSGKFVLTPMDGRLRAAGLVEFGSLSPERNESAFSLLRRHTLALFPELEYDRIDEWMGYRPTTIDSLPMIGGLDKVKNMWSAFGHQHIGLSGGPKTGRWISQLITGQPVNIDLSSFNPDRFEL